MKKYFLLFILLIGILFSCTNNNYHNSKGKVTCYRSHTSTGELIFWYCLLMPNGNHYYYNSNTQITNFNNVNWSNDNTGFNPNQSEIIDVQSVESNGFNSDIQNEFNSIESEGFNETPSGSESINSESNNSINESESSGFSDSGSSGDSGGGDSGGD